MKVTIAVFLRAMFLISTALMVYDYIKIEQYFIQMERGIIDGFEVYISPFYGNLFAVVSVLFLLANIIQLIVVKRNKNAEVKSFLTFEYDVTDERTVDITRKSVSYAFAVLLIYSLIVIGSYMFIPNYFLDYPWYPIFATASIPIVGLITYLISFKVYQYK
ncbi:hypothetical protein [Sporosarcina sp. USHLN248]|uniref:hypothetical protein n=1 Tax=Sporosarcina sp. USHLN248 TaxID=3081300 RepID=UPI003016A292